MEYFTNAENKELTDVEVLLATYNGESYLREFLDSLLNQKNVWIHLLVSDDGSSDSTLNIVKEYEPKFKTLRIIEGPQKGPAENFFYLLQNSIFEFIALADQDDIWLPNHLNDSIKRLEQLRSGPKLTFSTLLEFDEKKRNEFHKWPKRNPETDVRNFITENLARGCTMVLNSELREIVNKSAKQNAVMHDWWILLIASCAGEISWNEKPEILYRKHDFNFTNNKKRKVLKLFELRFRINKWKVYLQIENLLASTSEFKFNLNRSYLENWYSGVSGQSWTNLFNLIQFSGRYRTTPLEDIMIRLYMFSLGIVERLKN